ncbi:MAG: NifU family protein [Phycisphaerales bacterium]|nr:NifU family protein [Planctomycetota bacterium]MCH8507571.1 NifU family protein [Phycisphaerales bacterium]
MPTPQDTTQHPLWDQVAFVIERIRPAVQADGGDIELVEITQSNAVRIRMHGACVGCPSASMTLRMGIERNLQDRVPGITGVEAVD